MPLWVWKQRSVLICSWVRRSPERQSHTTRWWEMQEKFSSTLMCLGKQEASCRRLGREHWELFGAVRRNMTLRCHHLKVVCQYYDGLCRVQSRVSKEIIEALCIYQPPVMSLRSAAKIIQGLSFCQRHVENSFLTITLKKICPSWHLQVAGYS